MIKSLKSSIFMLIFVLLMNPMLNQPHNPMIFQVQAQATQLTINNVQILPTYPKPNEPITVKASIFHVYALDYAILSWAVNGTGTYTNTSLHEDGSQQFTGVIPGQPDGTILQCVILVKDVNGNTARWPNTDTYEIQVLGSATPIPTPINTNVSLTPGTRMLNVSSAGVLLELHLRSNLAITVDFASTDGLNTTYRIIHAISSTISIHVNDTNALDFALLYFSINVSNAMRHGLHATDFIAYTREEGKQWQSYPATVNFQGRIAMINTTHFSDWVIASSEPNLNLEITNPPNPVPLNHEFTLTTTVKNYGGSTLQNITLQVFHVESLLVTSGFEQAFLDALDGNSEKSLEWSFLAKETGEYNLVFVATAGSNYSISTTIQFTVEQPSESSTTESPLTLSSIIPSIFLIIPILSRRPRKPFKEENM